MLEPTYDVCVRCDQEVDDHSKTRCPICFKIVCSDCARSKGGKEFCSQYCAEYFFHYEDSPLLVVNTDNIDFVRRPRDLEDLTRRILEPFEGTLVYAPSWES